MLQAKGIPTSTSSNIVFASQTTEAAASSEGNNCLLMAKMNIFSDLRSYSHSWMKEFIESYKNEVCLWENKHPDYNNHVLRNEAYERLVGKLKEVESKANRSMVVRKINSLRSAFRREFRKKCLRSHYQPRLWYYDLLEFISEQPNSRKSSLSRRRISLKKRMKNECLAVDLDDSDESQYETHECEIKTDNTNVVEITVPDQEIQQAVHIEPEVQQQTITGSSIQIQKEYIETTSEKDHQLKTFPFYKPECIPFINSAIKQEDEFDAVGHNVASKLRSMNQTQRIIAEKLISDVLFNGQLDHLTVHAKLLM